MTTISDFCILVTDVGGLQGGAIVYSVVNSTLNKEYNLESEEWSSQWIFQFKYNRSSKWIISFISHQYNLTSSSKNVHVCSNSSCWVKVPPFSWFTLKNRNKEFPNYSSFFVQTPVFLRVALYSYAVSHITMICLS